MHNPYQPPAQRTAQVSIQTDHGALANYEIGQYLGRPGWRLLTKLTQIGSPVARLFELAVKAFSQTEGMAGLNPDSAEDQAAATAELLKHIDADGLEDVLRRFVQGIVSAGDDQLLVEILSCVISRKVASGPNGVPETAHPAQHFDRVFQGNYGELLRACYHCLVHNYGPAIRTFLEGNGLGGLAAGVFAQIAARPQSSASPSA